jgi:serine/threonine-protein kinase
VIAERYRLIRELGEGGMGVVWVAHSLVLGVDVAIKLIRAGRADPELASRMAREAQVTATLGHPAIVRVFDFGTTERGEPFLVMELAHGETLASLIRREQRVEPTAALRLILPIIDGLRCAHERGIVHRDIKPENVFIARDGFGRLQPKLLDFGIALLEEHTEVNRLTQLGEVLGSPEFMSPEQARGMGNVDLRTDVWALCVVLYNLLTGAVPFPIANYNALMQAILHQKPTPTTEHGAGDRDLWQIIAKGLEKAKAKRWANMSELGEAIALWLFDHGVTEDIVGNSLKTMWLSGHRPTVGNLVELETGSHKVASLGGTTLHLRLRRLKFKAERWLTPKVLIPAGVVLVAAFVPLAVRPAPEPTAAKPVAAAPSPAPTETAVTALKFADLPKSDANAEAAPAPSAGSPSPSRTSGAAGKRTSGKVSPRPGPTTTTTARRAGQAPAKKSIRDFGF